MTRAKSHTNDIKYLSTLDYDIHVMHIIAELKTKLHSSATINKHKKNILEEVQKKIHEYSTCAEVKELKKLADNLQVFWQPSVHAMFFFN